MDEKKLFKITILLSAIGVILASYLFYSYISPNPPEVCSINASVNCDAVTKGGLATIAGFPVSVIGLIGYIVILISSILQKKRLLLGMTTFGMIFCLRLTILEIFVEKIICPVCILCQIIMLVVFVFSIRLNQQPKKSVTLEENTNT